MSLEKARQWVELRDQICSLLKRPISPICNEEIDQARAQMKSAERDINLEELIEALKERRENDPVQCEPLRGE